MNFSIRSFVIEISECLSICSLSLELTVQHSDEGKRKVPYHMCPHEIIKICINVQPTSEYFPALHLELLTKQTRYSSIPFQDHILYKNHHLDLL